MKRTWRNIIIVSFIIILAEAVGALLFLWPYYKVQCVFSGIDNGQYTSAQKYYNELNDKGKESVQSNLWGYGAYLCQQYIDGELTYEELVASFDAINSIDETGEIMKLYMSEVNHNELKASIKGRFNALTRFDNNLAYEYSNRLTLLQQRMDNDERESVMIELLNEYYVAFIDGSIESNAVISFADMISTMSYGAAYDYSLVVQNNVAFVTRYRNDYNTANAAFRSEDYFDAIEICRSAVVDESDTKYQDLFVSLLNNSYTMGKIYYEDLLDSYIDDGDKDSAVALMARIAECYGSDFDLSNAKEKLAEPWQLAYVNLIRNIDESLENDLYNFETGRYIYEHEYDNLKPDSVLLHDIDEDGTPELFLFNSSQVGNAYIGCFIYNFNGTSCSFLNYVNVKSFGTASCLIGFPIAFERTTGDENSIVWYDGETLSTGNYVQEIGGTYYVGGAESNDVDYLAAKTEILSYADAYNVGNSKYVSLEDGESYILAYEN